MWLPESTIKAGQHDGGNGARLKTALRVATQHNAA